MKKGLAIAIVAIVVIAAVGLFVYEEVNSSGAKIEFVVADTPMANVSAVYITFSSVEIHGNSTGWNNYSIGSKTVNILGLTASNASLLSTVTLKPQVYTMFRIFITNVTVTVDGVNATMHLPIDYGFLNHAVDIKANSTGKILFEFNLSSDMNMVSMTFQPNIGIVYEQ